MYNLNMIKHIAIIPDGNRRWAKKIGIAGRDGHRTGVETTERIFTKALELKIPYITFWTASYDNLINRSKEEVRFLTWLINKEFQKLLKGAMVNENRIKIRILGRFKEFLPEKTLKVIEKLMEKTQKHNLLSLTFLLAYNGTDEMLEAVKKITKAAKESAVKITSEAIKNFLWTKDLPPVDLIIRTGCENDPHNSAGFMMWHTAHSQYYFTKTLYPDFSAEEFEDAVQDFLKRERRFGK